MNENFNLYDKLLKRKILITGANGFVGSNLFEALKGDFHLVGLDIVIISGIL